MHKYNHPGFIYSSKKGLCYKHHISQNNTWNWGLASITTNKQICIPNFRINFQDKKKKKHPKIPISVQNTALRGKNGSLLSNLPSNKKGHTTGMDDTSDLNQ